MVDKAQTEEELAEARSAAGRALIALRWAGKSKRQRQAEGRRLTEALEAAKKRRGGRHRKAVTK